MHRLLTYLILGLLCMHSHAQEPHAYIKNLKANSHGGKLIVSWTTKAGFSCQDMEVQLSTDSNQFERKAIYFGICGDTTERDYTMVVDSPYLNQRNYIRLDLGIYGYSYVIGIDVLFVPQALVVPNPILGTGVLYFNNPLRSALHIQLIDAQGRSVYEGTTLSDQLDISQLCLLPGIHYYLIRNGSAPLFRGSFAVISGNGECH